MIKDKSKATTAVLVIMSIFLIGAVVYITSLLTTGNGEPSKAAPQKTKAANTTYSRTLALNTTSVKIPPTETPTPVIEETPAITGTEALTPTPTEIILAYKNPTITGESTISAQITTTISPTKVKGLPDAGFVYNGLIIFAAAGLLIFFSFLF